MQSGTQIGGVDLQEVWYTLPSSFVHGDYEPLKNDCALAIAFCVKNEGASILPL